METSPDKIEDLIALRLLSQAEGKVEDTVKREEPESTKPVAVAIQTQEGSDQILPTADFIKIEKNLTSLGFFTPSSKKIKEEKAKTISFIRVIDGKRVEAKVTIVPAALYGLPVTADQDKYFALQKIITDQRQEEGEIKNPIGFTSADLLRMLGKRVRTGKNYQEVSEWLDLMTSTTIISEGAVYLAGKKTYAKDRFHVFERAVSFGKEMEPGVIADRNYVWLSEWQLHNINNNYLLPIDFDAYKQLKNHIAKALVPFLQIWLYATRDERSFEKRYDELCQTLNIQQYRHLSEIKRNFAPSLDELKSHGYITDWKIEKTSDKKAYKIIFYHGAKFHRDLQHRRQKRKHLSGGYQDGEQSFQKTEPGTDAIAADPRFLELTKRGITESGARKLIINLAVNQQVIDQLEWGDHLITQRQDGGLKNPPGFYVYLIQNNVSVPETFETSRQRQLREESRAQMELVQAKKLELEQAYEDYQREEIDEFISKMNPLEFEQMLAQKKQEFLSKHSNASMWEEATLAKLVRGLARSEVAKRIAFTTFDAFAETYHPSSPPETTVIEQNTPASAPDGSDPFLTV